MATAVLTKYASLDDTGKHAFFSFLNSEFDIEGVEIARLGEAYAADPSPQNFKSLTEAAESQRTELFRRLNDAPFATPELVQMRSELLKYIKLEPGLRRTDLDFIHLLRSWFNRGFLVLRQINWDSPAAILEKLIEYEAVHEIRTWDDLRSRLHPKDRRCFAFFHPAMPDDPLIFVVVALTKTIPGSIQDVLADDRQECTEDEATTAVFYSISNCQDGLAGISFGDSLIKQVVRDLSVELPNLRTFVTLSPIPGLAGWLADRGLSDIATDKEALRQLAAHYLVSEKSSGGKPLNSVARFHLGNGALIHNIHTDADTSHNGMAQSLGAMVNYKYDLSKISQNLQMLSAAGDVATSVEVRGLVKHAAKFLTAPQAGSAE